MRYKQDTRIRNRNDDIVNRWLTRIQRFVSLVSEISNSEMQIYTFSMLIDNRSPVIWMFPNGIVEIEYRETIFDDQIIFLPLDHRPLPNLFISSSSPFSFSKEIFKLASLPL